MVRRLRVGRQPLQSRNGYVAGRSVPLIVGEWGLWQVDPKGRPAGGDDPVYIQNTYDWMKSHNVYYGELFRDARRRAFPRSGRAATPCWAAATIPGARLGSPYPKSAAQISRKLFGKPRQTFPPVPTMPAKPFRRVRLSEYVLPWQLAAEQRRPPGAPRTACIAVSAPTRGGPLTPARHRPLGDLVPGPRPEATARPTTTW